MISIKIHRSYRDVVAVADTDLIGKVFLEENRQLDVKESFYKDQIVDFEQAVEIMSEWQREDATFNIVGKNSINAAIDAGIINEQGVGEIDGIPFALILM